MEMRRILQKWCITICGRVGRDLPPGKEKADEDGGVLNILCLLCHLRLDRENGTVQYLLG